MCKHTHSADIYRRMDNIPGNASKLRGKLSLQRLKHAHICVVLELMKSYRRQQRGRHASSISLSLFMNTPRGELCTVSYNAYNVQRFQVPP